MSAKSIKPLIAANVEKASMLMTDESPIYYKLGKSYAQHGTVNHSKEEYARLGGFVHINTAESFFSIVKRGVTGSFHHVSEAHLHRYLCEFDYRWNTRDLTDAQRMSKSIDGIAGRRLTYRRIGEVSPQ